MQNKDAEQGCRTRMQNKDAEQGCRDRAQRLALVKVRTIGSVISDQIRPDISRLFDVLVNPHAR
jgi:hypothetical protein